MLMRLRLLVALECICVSAVFFADVATVLESFELSLSPDFKRIL
jgi:hypothetical protein